MAFFTMPTAVCSKILVLPFTELVNKGKALEMVRRFNNGR